MGYFQGNFRVMLRSVVATIMERKIVLVPVFEVDLNVWFVLIYCTHAKHRRVNILIRRQGMATKSNFILKVQDAKLADVQKALKDANINVVSILEVHKEEA